MKDIRSLLHDLADALANAVEAHQDAATWYTQETSPLPRSVYLRLARSGKLASYRRIGNTALVRRSELDAFIDAHKVEPFDVPEPELDEDATVKSLLRKVS